MIITLGRQHGSNGHDIARALAKELGCPCYDKEIVDHAAENSSFSKEIFGTYDEKRVSSYIVPTPHYMGMHEGFRLNMQVAAVQFDAIRSLAERGDGIFVGRCADYILRDREDALHVFIHAPKAQRAERIVKLYGESDVAPEKRLDDKDARRRVNYRHFTGSEWGDGQNYHMSLDSSALGIETCVDLIAEVFRK